MEIELCLLHVNDVVLGRGTISIDENSLIFNEEKKTAADSSGLARGQEEEDERKAKMVIRIERIIIHALRGPFSSSSTVDSENENERTDDIAGESSDCFPCIYMQVEKEGNYFEDKEEEGEEEEEEESEEEFMELRIQLLYDDGNVEAKLKEIFDCITDCVINSNKNGSDNDEELYEEDEFHSGLNGGDHGIWDRRRELMNRFDEILVVHDTNGEVGDGRVHDDRNNGQFDDAEDM